jgi:hypothetical protein
MTAEPSRQTHPGGLGHPNGAPTSQGGQYAVVPPPQGAVVPSPPPSCSTVDLGSGKTYDCGGAFYSSVPNGYAVVPPPIGIVVPALPNGAVVHTVGGGGTSALAVPGISRCTAAVV